MLEKYKLLLFQICKNLASKRTWVFGIATLCLFENLIVSSEWMVIAAIYLGDKVASSLLAKKNPAGENAPEE